MPITGLEIAAGQTAMSGIGSAFNALWHHNTRLQNINMATDLVGHSWSVELPELNSTLAAGLVRYVNSKDFETVATGIALAQFQEAAGINTSISYEVVSAQLRNGMERAIAAEKETLDELALFLGEKLKLGVAQVIAGSPYNRDMPPEVLARLTLLASDQSLAIIRNSKLLEQIVSLATIDLFERELREQIRALKGRMNVQNTGAVKSVEFGSLYVQPTLTMNVPDCTRVDAGELIRNMPRLVVLGNPGGGKSTLAAKTVYDL